MADFLTPGEQVIHEQGGGHQKMLPSGEIDIGSNYVVRPRQIGVVKSRFKTDDESIIVRFTTFRNGKADVFTDVIVAARYLSRLHHLDTTDPEEVEKWLEA